MIVGWKICGLKVGEPSTPTVGHGSGSAIHGPTQKCRPGIVERDESRLNPNYGHAILYARDIILCTRAQDIILYMDIIYGIVYCILFCVLELYIVYCVLYIVYCIYCSALHNSLYMDSMNPYRLQNTLSQRTHLK